MQGCRERNAAPLSPRPSGRAALIETFTFLVVSAVGPATAAMSRKSLLRLAKLMVVEVNLPPFAAASHTISNNCTRDGPHDRFVGRTKRGKHSRQSFLLLLGFLLFVDTIEVIEGERNIF